jgi:hypothetical protein
MSSANIITKEQGRWRGCRGGHCLFKVDEGALFDIREIFEIKKSLHVRFIRQKLQIMNPLKRALPQKSPPPPTLTSFQRPSKKLTLFIQFSAALSVCLFLPKIARIN